MRQTTIIFIFSLLIGALSPSCSSSDSGQTAADSALHAYDEGDRLVTDFTKIADKAQTMTPSDDWATFAVEVGNAIVERDVCDGKGTISGVSFQKFNELLGNINAKVESLPQNIQDVYNSSLAPLLEKAADAQAETVTEEVVTP